MRRVENSQTPAGNAEVRQGRKKSAEVWGVRKKKKKGEHHRSFPLPRAQIGRRGQKTGGDPACWALDLWTKKKGSPQTERILKLGREGRIFCE